MFHVKRVLIVGAGASVDYGLPLGGKLLTMATQAVKSYEDYYNNFVEQYRMLPPEQYISYVERDNPFHATVIELGRRSQPYNLRTVGHPSGRSISFEH